VDDEEEDVVTLKEAMKQVEIARAKVMGTNPEKDNTSIQSQLRT